MGEDTLRILGNLRITFQRSGKILKNKTAQICADGCKGDPNFVHLVRVNNACKDVCNV